MISTPVKDETAAQYISTLLPAHYWGRSMILVGKGTQSNAQAWIWESWIGVVVHNYIPGNGEHSYC